MRIAHCAFALMLTLGGLVLGSSPAPARVAGSDDEPTPAREAPSAFHDGFETPAPAWESEHSDTQVNLLAQERSVRAAHDGNQSERFEFEADAGSQFFVSYALPKIPVVDATTMALYVRSNRSGVQIHARIVLPADIDPETKAPSFVMIPGPIYDRADRWQRLEISAMMPSIERQARVLRASTRRPVSLQGAYLDRAVVNLLGSPGASEVFLDNLTVTPVAPEVLAAAAAPSASPPSQNIATGDADQNNEPPLIRLDQGHLRKLSADRRYHDWFPTAIDAPGADFTLLRRYGFDVLVDDHKAAPEEIEAAIEKGYLLIPKLSGDLAKTDPNAVIEEAKAYPYKDAVAFWQIGEGLGRKRDLKARDEELKNLRKVMSAFRQFPTEGARFTMAEAVGDLPLYTRAPEGLDAVNVRPLLWGSAQHPQEGLEFLHQRRRLAAKSNASELFWAWLPAAAPAVVRENIWGDDVPPSWGQLRVRPEQLRLMTYMALSAGYRGIGFLGDSTLTRPAGYPLLIEMAFLNEEIDLFESILARGIDPIPVYQVYDPPPSDIPPPGTPLGRRVKPQPELKPKPTLLASSIAVERKGALLLLTDYAPNAQYQPPQMAARNLVLRAALPEGAQAFEVCPGEVRLLERKRAPGGTELMIEEFDTTAMILCTTDLALKERVETAIARVRPLAVSLAIEQAERLLLEVVEINGRLLADGKSVSTDYDLKQRAAMGISARPNDERDLIAMAEASIKAAREAQEREDFPLAWREARRASRPLRTLMFGHWAKAVNALAAAAHQSLNDPSRDDVQSPPLLIKPVSCAPAVAFNTLPELYFWIDWIGGKLGHTFGENRLPSGSFDDPGAMAEAGWVNLDYQLEGITSRMATIPHPEKANNRIIRLNVDPADKKEMDRLPSFLDFPVAAVRSPALKVEAKNLIRISVLVKRSFASSAGMGGIIVRDSIGGEQLQFRTSDPIPEFSRVVLYRKAPADMDLTVTLGLAGYGEAFFDDLRIELIEEPLNSGPRGSEIADSVEPPPVSEPDLPDTNPPTTARSEDLPPPR